MDAATVVIAFAAGALALKILADLTIRHLAVERVRLENEANVAAVKAAAQVTPGPSGAGGTDTQTAP